MLKLYNALEKKVTEFKPTSNVVKMYSCGPTVYYYAHIGNMRAYIFMDLIRRALKYNGYQIDGVMNITDVGHMTSDEDEGEDKMELASRREKRTPYEIAEYYSKFFFTSLKKLNIDVPEHIVKATDCISDIIEFVKGLLEKGFAYETSKGIYFNVAKFPNYGCLSGCNLEDKKAGARIEVDTEKVNPYDFALWIKAPKEHIMQWQSPWGMGYPGWHIECSAMCKKFLGEDIDIHTGGIDHASVHHENEIAQNDCLAGHQVVKRWMHVEFLQFEGGKMSKSLNNIYTIEDLEDAGYAALSFRLLCLTAHYSKKQNFTFEALESADSSLRNLFKKLDGHKKAKYVDIDLSSFETEFLEAINNDLNAPLALAVMWDMVKTQKKNKKVYDLALKFDQFLGLRLDADAKELHHFIPKEIVELAEQRWIAKNNKDWKTADELRAKILDRGFVIKDDVDSYEVIDKNKC